MLTSLKKILPAALLMIAAAASAAVDANKASQAELETVKGIGPTVSTRVLDARKTAPFKDWDDFIVRVQGVGTSKAAKLSAEGLTVNGTPYGTSTAAAPAKAATKPAKAEPKSSK